MSIENQNIKQSSSEQEPVTPEFLRDQINLPKEKWDERFRQIVDQKIKEKQKWESEESDNSPEAVRERTFRRYMDGLGLKTRDLKDKKVLDLGCGDGDFVRSLIEKKITSEAYGVDAEPGGSAVEEKFKSHFFQGNYEKTPSVKGADYVISMGSVSLGVWGGEVRMDISKIVENSLAVLNEGGEIRIAPIHEPGKAKNAEGLVQSLEKWKELMAEISEKQGFEWEIEPVEVQIISNKNEAVLSSVLIIRKKKLA